MGYSPSNPAPGWNDPVKFDDRGVPYMTDVYGQRKYLSPAAMRNGTIGSDKQWNQDTGVAENRQGFWEKAAPWLAGGLLTAGIGNAAMAGGSLLGGGGAVTPAASGGHFGTLLGGLTAPTAATAATTAGTAGFPWGSVIGSALGVGGQLFGAHMALDANSEAARLAAQSSREALDFEKQKAAQERADYIAAQNASYEQWAARERRLSPYRANGQGANDTLAGLLGLPHVNIAPPGPPPAFLKV